MEVYPLFSSVNSLKDLECL